MMTSGPIARELSITISGGLEESFNLGIESAARIVEMHASILQTSHEKTLLLEIAEKILKFRRTSEEGRT